VEVLQKPYSDLSAALAARSRAHGVTDLDAQQDFLSYGRGILEEVLFNGGRPLPTIPQDTDAFHAEGILVAWDGRVGLPR
jgi:hypothetical protein